IQDTSKATTILKTSLSSSLILKSNKVCASVMLLIDDRVLCLSSRILRILTVVCLKKREKETSKDGMQPVEVSLLMMVDLLKQIEAQFESLHKMHPFIHLGLNVIEALRARNLPPSYDKFKPL